MPDAATIAALASLVAAVGSVLATLATILNRRAIIGVHDEVKTSNGITMAVLADRAEGRRIEADVPAEDRTPAEQHYVANLNAADAKDA